MLTSVLEQAVPELLEQHHCYQEDQLVGFLAKYYPEVPETLRGPIVVAATLGAKRAALMHVVGEKNAMSNDPKKKQIAAEAASSHSFWALGMRSSFRSAKLVDHASSLAEASVPSPQSKPVLHSSVKNATSGDIIPPLTSIQLPVPVHSGDSEFEALYNCLRPLAGSDLLSPISSTAISEVAVSTALVSSGSKLEVPLVINIDDDSGYVGVPEIHNDVEPDSPLQLTAPDDEELSGDCITTTVDQLATGSTSVAVAMTTFAVSTPLPVTPAAMCPAVASPLAPRLQVATGPLSISPCSGRLLSLSKRTTPIITAGEPRSTYAVSTPISMVASVTAKSGEDKNSTSRRRSAHQNTARTTNNATTTSKRMHEETRSSRVISMDDEEYRRFREFVSQAKIKKK